MTIYITDKLGVLSGPVELPVIPGLGIQLPSNAVELPAPLGAPAAGHVWVLVDGTPQEREDRRGTYYSTEDGRAVRVEEVGPLPGNVTPTPRPSEFHEWAGADWALNEAAQSAALAAQVKQQRDAALHEATTRIAPLQDAVDLGMATEAEAEQLRQWKVYRVQLSRIEQQAGFPASVDWPAAPPA